MPLKHPTLSATLRHWVTSDKNIVNAKIFRFDIRHVYNALVWLPVAKIVSLSSGFRRGCVSVNSAVRWQWLSIQNVSETVCRPCSARTHCGGAHSVPLDPLAGLGMLPERCTGRKKEQGREAQKRGDYMEKRRREKWRKTTGGEGREWILSEILNPSLQLAILYTYMWYWTMTMVLDT